MNTLRRIAVFAVLLSAAGYGVAASNSEPPACVLGDQALAQKQPDLAIIQYDKCLSNNPPTFKVLSSMGIAYAQQQKYAEAIQSYTQALALEPDNSTIHIDLGLAYLKAKDPKKAQNEFALALIANPRDGKTLELLALCHLQLGDYAVAAYEAGLVNQASPGDPSAAYILGVSYMQLGMYVQAIPFMVQSLSQAKSAEAYRTLGRAWMGVKNWPKALEAFQNAVKMDPNAPGIYADLGEAQAELGQMNEAKAAYLKELAQDSENFKANYLLGQLDRQLGNDADATKYLNKANELQPGSMDVAYELADLAMQEQEYQKAEGLLQDIVQKVPSFTNAHVLLAEAYFHLHKTQEGMKERAIASALQQADHAHLEAEGRRLKWLSGGKSETQEPGNQ